MLELQATRLFRHLSERKSYNWFVLADTEKLHQKIEVMSDRIRQLEDALAILQSTQTREPHPLLTRDFLKIKSIIELHAAGETGEEALKQPKEEEIEESQTIDAFGTLAIRDDGAATFYGRSAGHEDEISNDVSSSTAASPETQSWNPSNALPSNVNALASQFPISPVASSGASPIGISLSHDIDFNTLVCKYLPEWTEAHRLCGLYMESATWFFGAVTKQQLEEEVLPTWYKEAPKPPETQQPLAQTPHDLALLFIILTYGAMADTKEFTVTTARAGAYHTLSKAALALAPVLERPPSVATVQTIALMGIYEGMLGGENSIEATWALMGLATKLAQSIGLHRDCARWNLPTAEVQKRRALFWELFITDCWQSLATGRLATFALPFVDCELPFDHDQTMTNEGVPVPSFPFWKARFGAECVASVVQGTLTSRAPRYAIILDLDRKVRDMELPAYAMAPVPEGAGLAQTMSHFMPTNYRELTLLYIHRCFFAHAIASHPTDPIRSQYAPSFLAGYRSACTILSSVRQAFGSFPGQIARFWVLWTHCFSASVMLASVVTHSSRSKVAPAALLELRGACELFEQASTFGGRAAKFLPILQRLRTKAHKVYIDTNNGIPPSVPGDIFRPTPPGGERNDELSIFSGKTHTLTTKSASRPRPPTAPTSSSSSSPRSNADSPNQSFMAVDNPSFANAHPSLVQELQGFEGHLAAQIRAYGPNGVSSLGLELSQEQSPGSRRMETARREQGEREEMERQQMLAMENQRLYQERLEEEQRQRQLREQQEQYRQQQLEVERQRQQQYQQQLHIQQTQQTSPQHYQTSSPIDPHQPPYPQSRRSSQILPQQHSMYPIPPEYRKTQPPPTSPTQLSSSSYIMEESFVTHSLTRVHKSRQSGDHTPTEISQSALPPPPQQQQQHPEYNQQYASYAPVPAQVPSQHPPQPHSAHQQTYHYWTQPENTYSSIGQVAHGQSGYGYQQQQHQAQHYTPDGALKGIAAEDTSLQETWQTYMNKVYPFYVEISARVNIPVTSRLDLLVIFLKTRRYNTYVP
ncbi:hypothetical protein H0H93_012161 [Arthromyces matolae]|nr:hypothetical protein H0H93_012161 [Arthromyces matolae]